MDRNGKILNMRSFYVRGGTNMYLYIMRHGETEDNTKRILQGQKNNPLNNQGKKQALEAREQLKDIVFDKIYVSPLIRAIETAELVTGRKKEEFIVENRIIEIGFGALEGTPSDKMEPPYNNFFKAPTCYPAPEGGESLEELSRRTWSFLEEIKGKFNGKKILVVSHGAAIHSMVYQIKKQSMEQFWDMKLGNCGIVEISDESGEYEIVKECQKRDTHYTRF